MAKRVCQCLVVNVSRPVVLFLGLGRPSAHSTTRSFAIPRFADQVPHHVLVVQVALGCPRRVEQGVVVVVGLLRHVERVREGDVRTVGLGDVDLRHVAHPLRHTILPQPPHLRLSSTAIHLLMFLSVWITCR